MITTAVAAIAAGTVAWAAAPFVSIARRGTLDDQGRAALRAEAAHLGTLRRARGGSSRGERQKKTLASEGRPAHADVARISRAEAVGEAAAAPAGPERRPAPGRGLAPPRGVIRIPSGRILR